MAVAAQSRETASRFRVEISHREALRVAKFRHVPRTVTPARQKIRLLPPGMSIVATTVSITAHVFEAIDGNVVAPLAHGNLRTN